MEAIADRFVELFSTASRTLECPEGTDARALRLAQDAVREMITLYQDKCSFATTLQGVFAEHSQQHILSLASQFSNVLARLNISDDSPLRDLRCLVLLFCSFAWHDAGMSILSGDGQSDVDDELEDIAVILRQVRVRRGHDTKSLLLLDRIDLGAELYRWTHFWTECTDDTWPSPVEFYARDLLATVCRSHGDAGPNWLTEKSLSSHTRSDANDEISFNEVFGDSWHHVKEIVNAAAAALNICDLLDIRKSRFRLPGERELALFTSENIEDRRQTLLHWAAHQVLTVEAGARKISLVVHPERQMSRLGLQVAAHAGPGNALLAYGNKTQLVGSLQRAGVEYEGIELIRGPVDDKAWRQIERLIGSDIFKDCWSDSISLLKIATAAGKSKPLEDFFEVEWWNLVAGELGLAEEGSESSLPRARISSELRVILRMLRSRLPLHQLVEVEPLLERPGPVVLKVESSLEGADRVAEAFVGGVALVRHFLADPEAAPLTPSVSLAFRGNETHRKLTAGDFSKDNAGSNIVFVCVRPNADLGDYAILKERTEGWPLVLFCCGSAEQERQLRPGMRSVAVRARPERLDALKQAVRAINVRMEPVQIDFVRLCLALNRQ